ncbi:MAG: VWA domain-containing protein [Bacteroidetes bacterium]|nr:MAG: VWA domain-containing protein [Bacteroidota bacterium]
MPLRWEAPEWLLLMPVWLVLLALALRLRLRTGWVQPSKSQKRGLFLRSAFPTLTLGGSLLLATLALSRPSLQGKQSQSLPTLWIVVDVSRSMKEKDLLPSRQAFVLEGLRVWIDSLEEQRLAAPVGLALFGERAYVVLPPTFDRQALRFAVEGLRGVEVGSATNLSDALRLLGEVAEPGHAAWVLSDGAHNLSFESPIPELAKKLQQKGLVLHTVFVGQEGPQRFPAALELLARMTGGSYQANRLDLTPLLQKAAEPVWIPLAPSLLMAALLCGLSGLAAMAVGGWFSVLCA